MQQQSASGRSVGTPNSVGDAPVRDESVDNASGRARHDITQHRAAAAAAQAPTASSPESAAGTVPVPPAVQLDYGARLEFQQLLDLAAKCQGHNPDDAAFAR